MKGSIKFVSFRTGSSLYVYEVRLSLFGHSPAVEYDLRSLCRGLFEHGFEALLAL